jgi:hypothetical protein
LKYIQVAGDTVILLVAVNQPDSRFVNGKLEYDNPVLFS